MDTDAIVSILAIIIAAGVAAWALYSKGQPVTLAAAQEAYTESQSLAAELTEAALTGARAAEQLYKTGRIERDERLDKAFDYVKTFFPALDQATILTAIESAVFIVGAIAAQVEQAKTPAPEIVVNVPAVPVVVNVPPVVNP